MRSLKSNSFSALLYGTSPRRSSSMSLKTDLTPLVLIIDDREPAVRAMEDVLRPKGHVILKAFSGKQAIDLLRKVSPDAILVARTLPDCDGIDLVREFRQTATVRETTPVLMTTTAGALGDAERLEAFAAGAWDILEQPIDPTALILRLHTFVRAKQEADRVRDEGLTDPWTGFYNVRGVLKRTKELIADSVRAERPLSCIAFGTQPGDAEGQAVDHVDQLAERIAQTLRKITRASDAIGCLAASEFVIVAPDTDRSGAAQLAGRLVEALDQDKVTTGQTGELSELVRVGVCAAKGPDASAEDLLLEATMALRRAQHAEGSFQVRAYEA